MTSTDTTAPPDRSGAGPEASRPGVLGRIGGWGGDHRRIIFGVWLAAIVVLGAFAPSVFSSLAGAGWQANGSESVAVRELAQKHFGGNASSAVQVVVHSNSATVSDPSMQAVFTQIGRELGTDSRFGEIVAPQPG